MTVRKATEADIDRIVEMSRRFYETTSYNGFAPMSDDAAAGLAQMMIDTGVMLVAELDDYVVGMVGLAVIPFMFNNDVLTAHEVIWWVEPEAQGSGVGKQLLEAVAPACRERGAVAAQMVHLASSPPQAAALYERLGYNHTESSYTRVL